MKWRERSFRSTVASPAIVLIASVALGAAAFGGPQAPGGPASTEARPMAAPAAGVTAVPVAAQVAAPLPAQAEPEVPSLPGGGRKIFGRHRFLVAYYGTAGTGLLGVLGERDPDTTHQRLKQAARPFRRDGERIQPVYELIVTVADAGPGTDGDYNHDIAHSLVQGYIDAAERNGALLVLDIQPGRSDFLTVARRWEWALQHPWVGLALDPEWRMGPHQVPAQVVGSVTAAEVNRVSAWLEYLVVDRALPQKVFMLHQFRTSMLGQPDRIKDRAHLAEVQHVDGFGTPSQKRATYAAVARPKQFTMGFKLFYDEDRPRMSATEVRRLRPAVRFVSFQ